ncbi:MAG: hypothetical protein AAF802_18030, partial [Planctomycetota bacterium]
MSRVDSVASGIVSLMTFLAALVFMMFVTWLLSGERVVVAQRMPIAKVSRGQAGIDTSQLEFEVPAVAEVEQLVEPTIEESIQAVTEAVRSATQSAATEASLNAGTADGDSDRTSGPESSRDIISRYERWELKFSATGKKDYARQLDFHGIELAAFGGSSVIEMVSQLASTSRRTVNENPESEERLYFSWRHLNPLMEYDRQLLGSAGISTHGRNIVRFVPADLEQKLATIEREHCLRNGETFPDSIAKTVFESH